MSDTMIQNLEEKTGKSINEWIAIVKTSGIEKHKAIIDFLKSEHGLTYGYANLVAHKAKATDAGSASDDSELIDGQFAGKEELRPIHDKLMSAVKNFGSDVEIAPKKAYVSLRRKKQFGIIQPSTKTRLDVGINLKDVPPTDRLEASGSFNSMVSHRVRVSSADEVDAELIGWLKAAFDAAG
ncbi:MAG: DUF4287 domain-containing protein [Calditrichia bacterium]